MNILFLSRDYPPGQIGGVGIYIYEAAQILTKLGHRVFVITGADEHNLEYVDCGIRIFRVKPKEKFIFNPIRKKLKNFVERLEYSFAVSQRMKEVIKTYKIDIVESSEARAEGFWYYFFRNKPPLVIKLHTPEGVVYRLNRDPITKERKLIEKVEEWWLWRAHKLVKLSEAIGRLTEDYYHIPCRNLPTLSNPINTELFSPLDYSQHKDYILYIGRLEYRKGVQILIKAIPSVLQVFPKVKFIFIGDDCGMKNYLLEKIKAFRIENSVEFIHQLPREKLVNYYQQSTVCVVPSLWENHPYVILEAMACGRAVIASDVGGIPEIIVNNLNGILVAPGSTFDLSRAIIQLLKDEKKRTLLARNARRYIEENYSPEKVIQETVGIYEKLVN